MFPLEYPLQVLKKHRKNHPVVMDPFCGRGTTLFAARQLGLNSRGIDSSPVAVAIAKAKLCKVDIEKTLQLAQSYIEANNKVEIPETEFFDYAFTPKVLTQICSIREALLNIRRENHLTVLLRAAMLGCLHGPRNKSLATQSYFSNQMPRTFSSKPDYSVKFWKSRDLLPPVVDVIDVLRRKISRLNDLELPQNTSLSDVMLGDSQLKGVLPLSRYDFSVIVTSPPYYGMRTYVEDQWLRNWFLGGDIVVKYGSQEQLRHTGKDIFAESLGAVWKNMAGTRADSLHMYVRFGAIPSSKVNPKDLIYASLEASGIKWQTISIRKAATASSGNRQATHMSTNSDAGTEYDFHVCRI
jgi:hypothetical protein